MKTDHFYAVAHMAVPFPAPVIEAEQPLPEQIMWMPPGTHDIEPLVEGERREITITVDESLAQEFAQQVAYLRSLAATGQGDVPFLDFNHEGGAASAEVLDLFWGGNDPKTGGIRAKVKWTKPGEEALRGRAYRRFSPQWFLAKDTLAPIGIGANLGGLVNIAAFRKGVSVIASHPGSPLNHQTKKQMPEETNPQLAQLPALIASIESLKTEVGKIAALATRVDTLETKASGIDAIGNRIRRSSPSATWRTQHETRSKNSSTGLLVRVFLWSVGLGGLSRRQGSVAHWHHALWL